MASLVENAIRIKQAFNNILSAIKSKSVTPSDEDDVSTYSSAIDSIQGGYLDPATLIGKDISATYWNASTVAFKSNSQVKFVPNKVIFGDSESSSYFSLSSGTVTIRVKGRYLLTFGVIIETGDPPTQLDVYAHKGNPTICSAHCTNDSSPYTTMGYFVDCDVNDTIWLNFAMGAASPNQYSGARLFMRLVYIGVI